jgi:hypothetical protein
MAQSQIAIPIAVWSIGIAVGLRAMLNFELSPAETPSVIATWPAGTRMIRDVHHPTLLLFLHPRCPCSRATLAELERLLAACPGRCSVRIIFVRPPGINSDWEMTALHRAALSIRNTTVISDENGEEAGRFGAATSGLALLYGHDGRLLFHGGLTASRGHEGDNLGRSTLQQLLLGQSANYGTAAVFGCPLLDQREP